MSAALVKELRERTGLGLMECKKALSEAGGDIDAAIEALRKSSGSATRVPKFRMSLSSSHTSGASRATP